ncbi:MAG: flagellar motor protein MotB, partial [Acidobacteriota bacterium]
KKKAEKVSASVKEALEQGHMPTAFMNFLGRKRPPETRQPEMAAELTSDEAVLIDSARAALTELTPSLLSLKSSLEEEIKQGKVTINLEPRGLVVSLKEAAFFPPAGDIIERTAYPIIGKIAASARRLTNRILLEGHTDSTPIHNDRFRSNWDLSAARAIAMLSVLSNEFELPVERMSVAGYAATVPIADNNTLGGRQQNRRVDVVFLNASAARSQPGWR